MVKEFSISLNEDTAENSYAPGSAISGSLTVEIDDPKSYTSRFQSIWKE